MSGTSLEITPVGFDELAGKIARYPALAKTHFGGAADRSAVLVQRSAKQKAPKRRRTLERSIHIEQLGDFGRAIGTKLVYARIHEKGGTIKAKHADFLTFQVNGQWVKVKSVHIPARPYMAPALEENRANINREFHQAGDALLAEIANS